jgi:HlyD family secretion protein
MSITKKRHKGRLKKILIVLVIVAVIIVICAKQYMSKNDVPEIETTNVKIGTVEEKLTETGNIELLRTVDVKSEIAGTIQKIYVKEGEEVRKNQDLCFIDPDPSQTLLLFQKRSSVAATKINLEQAQKEVERKRELAKTSLVSQKDLEDAENSYLISVNGYNLAIQELQIMEREIETSGTGSEERIVSSKVRAPYDGYITKKYIEEGALVMSGMSSYGGGTSIFQIGDPSTKIIKAQISEVDIGKVKVDAPVHIKLDAYPDTSFAGKILNISPIGELQQGRNVITFKTEVEIIDKDPRLQPGMSCDVDVMIATFDSTFYLPIEAIFEKKEESDETEEVTTHKVIYVKKPDIGTVKKKFGLVEKKTDPYDQFEERPVEVGIRSESRYQVLSLQDTTAVIVNDAEQFAKELENRKEQKSEKTNAKKSSTAS